MKRNMPTELGWGIGTEGSWNQHNSAPGSGSWTSATNQDSASSWQVINKSDSASDAGDDASSGKSVSTVTSAGNATSQSQDSTSNGNTSILQSSSNNSWGTPNPTPTSMDSGPWGSSSSPAPTSIGTIGWSTNPSSLSVTNNNHQGQSSNMQSSSIIGNSVGSSGLSVGWPVNNVANTSTLPPSLGSGLQSNSLSSHWQSSTMLGNIGDFTKASDSGWSNPSSSLHDNKDLISSNSDSRMWGLSSDKTSDSQWDTSKNQWGNTPLSSGNEQGVNNTEMSFAQATLKGLKLPPATNAPQTPINSRQEEILRAVENHEGWGSRPIRQDTRWDIETSPKSLRKFSDGNAVATNVPNNSNGTDNWKNIRGNPSNGTENVVGPGGSFWNTDKDQSNWGGMPKPSIDSNTLNVGGNVDTKNFGTWGTATGAGDASNKMWGQKQEACTWGDRSGAQCPPSISSWGEDGDTGPCDDQRRMASGMVGIQVMVPPSPGIGVPSRITRMVPQGMPGMGMTTIGSDTTPWNEVQKAGWNSTNSTTVAHPNMDEPWNKPPPTRSDWGDGAHEGIQVDNGTMLWAENAKQGKAINRIETGPPGQWNTAVVTKPKLPPSGWDEASWALAHRAKMPQKIISSGSNPPTQMRAKLLQHLMDMGYRKEDAQNALITNNMNLEMAINDLKMGNVNLSRKDLDMDIFQANVSQPRMPYMSKGGLGGDDILDIRPDQVPPFHNMQNNPISNHTFMPNNASLPPSSLSLNNSSINSSLQQKLVPQQAPPTTIGQRVTMPPAVSGSNSQASQQQIRAQLSQAVSNGYISPQLMNYQLPHNILVLIQQLLQLQTALQTAMSSHQQLMQQARASGNRSNPQLEQLAGIIGNINQQIINVQKQLQLAQNTLFNSQKPPNMTQQSPGTVTSQTHTSMGDSLDALSTDLANVALHSQQSRLATQWKPTTDTSLGITSDTSATITMKAADENGDNKAPGGKAGLQSSSSPNLTLIPGGLGMTGDKTWSSNMSTTSSTNWPLSTDSTSTNSQTDLKSSISTRITTSLLSGISSGTDVIPEFVPGKPWQGLTKNVEDDPHVTPGSIQLQRSLSVNRVHDDSLNHLDGYKLNSTSWGTSLKTDNNLGLSQLGNHPPPGMGLAKGVSAQQWSSASVNRQTSWPHSSSSAFTKVTGSNWNDNMAPSSWILLKNLTVDPSTVRALSAQHGSVVNFYPLAQGQFALVQYSNRKVAYVAQQRLNNFQMGMSGISAEFINESDAQRIIAQIPPPQPNNMPLMNTSPWSQAPPFTPTPFQNTGVRSGDPWSTAAQINSKYGSANENPWGLWDRPDYNPNVLSNFLGGESI